MTSKTLPNGTRWRECGVCRDSGIQSSLYSRKDYRRHLGYHWKNGEGRRAK